MSNFSTWHRSGLVLPPPDPSFPPGIMSIGSFPRGGASQWYRAACDWSLRRREMTDRQGALLQLAVLAA